MRFREPAKKCCLSQQLMRVRHIQERPVTERRPFRGHPCWLVEHPSLGHGPEDGGWIPFQAALPALITEDRAVLGHHVQACFGGDQSVERGQASQPPFAHLPRVSTVFNLYNRHQGRPHLVAGTWGHKFDLPRLSIRACYCAEGGAASDAAPQVVFGCGPISNTSWPPSNNSLAGNQGRSRG